MTTNTTKTKTKTKAAAAAQSLRDRLRQPSTWAGVGGVITSGAVAWATKDPQAIAATVAGLLAIVLNEKGAR